MKRKDVKKLTRIIEMIKGDLDWMALRLKVYEQDGDFEYVKSSWEYLHGAAVNMQVLKSAIYEAVDEEKYEKQSLTKSSNRNEKGEYK